MPMKLKNYGRNQKKRKEYSEKLAFAQKTTVNQIIQWISLTFLHLWKKPSLGDTFSH